MAITFTPWKTNYQINISHRRKYSKQSRIPGEYTRVTQWTREYFRLKKAHETPITIEIARELIKKLGGRYGISPIKVVWRTGVRRGRGGVRKGMPFISLPTEILKVGDLYPEGKLRVGLVLHEFAHVIQKVRKVGGPPHSLEFVRILDQLLKEEITL